MKFLLLCIYIFYVRCGQCGSYHQHDVTNDRKFVSMRDCVFTELFLYMQRRGNPVKHFVPQLLSYFWDVFRTQHRIYRLLEYHISWILHIYFNDESIKIYVKQLALIGLDFQICQLFKKKLKF